MKGKNLLSAMLMAISITSFSQDEIWYFGASKDGLNFTGGGAPSVIGVPLGKGPSGFYECNASVSDGFGNLFFYTDGLNIYNKNHDLMPDGGGLSGPNEPGQTTGSSSQGVIIVQDPGNADRYYVLYADCIHNNFADGYRYTIVDMTLDGGNGDVVPGQKDLIILNGSGSANQASEFLNAVCIAGTTWVLSHKVGTNEFLANKITATGIDIVPVVSAVGPTLNTTGNNRGTMSFSHDGKKLAMACGGLGVYSFDFDAATGFVSNASTVHTGLSWYYGTEWSPDDSKIYYTNYIGAPGLSQYDIASGTTHTYAGGSLGSIRLAPDGKLYAAPGNPARTALSVVNNPDALAGAANYVQDQQGGFSGGWITLGLPDNFVCIPQDTCLIDSVTQICDTVAPFQFTANYASGSWGGGPYITNLGIFDPAAAGAGTHWITFQGACVGPDSVQIVVVACCPNVDPSLGADVKICDDVTVTLDAGTGLTTYEWKENGVVMAGQTGSTIVADSGTYIVNVTDANGCPGTDTIEIDTWPLPIIDLGPDTFYCATDSILIDAGPDMSSYVWTPNLGSGQSIYATSGGTYTIIATNANGCIGFDTVVITQNALPIPTITGNTIVCTDSTTLITGVAGSGGSLAWSGITPFVNPLPVTAGGTYTIIETDASGCVDSADYTLTLVNLPVINLGGPYTFCFSQGNQVLDASTGGANETYVWSDASTNSTLNVTDSSIVSVIVTSQNGCIGYDTAVIDTFSLPVVDLGPDTFYCAQDSFLLDAGAGYTNYAWTPNVGNGQTIFATTATTYSVIITDANSCTGTDAVVITERALPIPTITGNTIVCQDSTTLITGVAGSGGTLAWSGITPFVNPLPVTAGGTYTIIETDASGCIDSADYTLTLENLPVVNLGGPYTFCFSQGNQTLDASTGASNETYVWSDGSNGSTLNVTDSSIVSVIVTSQNGCIGYDTVVIDTFSLPVVDLGPDTFYCANDSIQLDAGAGFINYAWTPNVGTGQTVFAKTQTTYSVIVTDGNGCTGTDDIIISENALPIVNIGPDTTICEADSFLLDATHVDAVSYAWTPNSETQAIIKVGSTPATYEVTITDVDGCVFVTDRTISQEALPIVNLGANDTICDDLTKTLDAGAGYSYVWYLDGNVTGTTTQTIAADSGTYVVSVTTALGCETRDTVLVDNFQLPVVNLGGPFEFCTLDSVQIDAANSTATFAWAPNGETTQTIWAKSPGTYTATVTDTNGCINSGSTTVTENTLPPVNLGANDSACVGLNIVLDATVPNGVTYDWSDGYSQGVYTITNPDTLSVIVTDANGCIGYDTIEIKMLQQLSLMFDDTTTECANDILDIDAGNYANGTFAWTLPNGSIDNSQVIALNTAGWYVLNITDQFNCKGEDSIFVVIIPVPNIDLGPDTSFCSLGQDTYTIEMVFTENVSGTITWSEGNNNSNDTLFTATYAPSTVIGTFLDVTGCSHIDTVELAEFCEPTKITMPNLFNPGGVNNPTFHPIEVDDNTYIDIVNNIVESKFEVYNRWGIKMAQSIDLLPRWDGMYENRPAASGTYYWIYTYTDSSLREYKLNGFVQVIQNR